MGAESQWQFGARRIACWALILSMLAATALAVGTTPADAALDVTISPSPLTFTAPQVVGTTSAAMTATVTNMTASTVTFTSVALGGSNASDFPMVNHCTGALAPSATCPVEFMFAPITSGVRTAVLTLVDNAPSGAQTLQIMGTGESNITFSAASAVDPFPGTTAVGSQTSNVQVVVTNNDTVSVSISNVTLSGSGASDFLLTDHCSGGSLATGNQCILDVAFSPQTSGTLIANVVVTDSAADSPQSLQVSGVGAVPAIAFSQTTVGFGSVGVGSSVPITVTSTNTGQAPLTFKGFTITGDQSFAVTTNNCLSNNLDVNNTCTVVITFTPSAIGSHTATLVVADNVPGSPQNLTLSGTGVPPDITFSPTSVTFNPQVVGTTSTATTITATNAGSVALVVSGDGVAGADPGDFQLSTDTCTGKTLQPGGTCTVSVAFTPTANGARSASFVLGGNAQQGSVPLSGSGIPIVSLTPSPANFGLQQVGTSSASTAITLTNNGPATLNVTSATVTGTAASDFVVTSDTCSSGSFTTTQTCTISVKFSPSVIGTRTANLMVVDSAISSPQLDLLTGTGGAGSAAVAPTSLTFPSTPVGSVSAVQTVTLGDTSSSQVTAITATVTGSGSADFVITGDRCTGTTLPGGGTCTIGVAFVPSVVGFRTATLVINDSALNSPQSVSLSGRGVTPTSGGYWLVASDGGIFSFGAPFEGSAGSIHLNKPIVGMAPTADGKGYWLVASDGGIFNYGDAAFEGSAGSIHLNSPIVGMAPTPDGKGYWLVASDGGIFNYGDAAFEGSAGSIHLNSPIVGMAPTPAGTGYWLVAADGGIFSYGAGFFGSAGAIHLNKPIVGMAASADGLGYWLVATDGGIFTYGDASFQGSAGSIKLNRPIVGMAPTVSGRGYWLVATDGGIFSYGDASFAGSTGSMPLNKPIVGMATPQ